MECREFSDFLQWLSLRKFLHSFGCSARNHGTLLFTLFVNDITKPINTNHLLSAYELKLYRKCIR